MGETSSRWPGDGVDGSLGNAMGEALEMQRDMAQMEADFKKEARERAEEARRDAYYAGAGAGDYADSTPN